ncbi:hypothetical protein WICMUC_000696 [Wickerhamomyces mucosus]|uniref:Bromo domain-containing protein n=1 Tax=Wickerhamomyces mucosus TaxID=1378264 RepID=A0A9P8THN8_9ASCO|nr:hypothetical protein WICMUC_000696 [Wickerhamomyces mucosus]
MARGRRRGTRQSHEFSDDIDESFELHNSSRQKNPVNYQEDDEEDDEVFENLLSDGPSKKKVKLSNSKSEDYEENNEGAEKLVKEEEDFPAEEDPEEDDDEEEVYNPRPRRDRGRSRKNNYKLDDDDEYNEENEDDEDEDEYNDDDLSEDSSTTRRRRPRDNFIVKDDSGADDDDDDDDEFNPYAKKKSKKPTSRKRPSSRTARPRARNFNLEIDGFDNQLTIEDYQNDDNNHGSNTLEDELAELRDSSASPAKSKTRLRQRKKEVNYQLPPPLPDNFEPSFVPSTPKRRAGGGLGPIRRLYATSGPFGGNDIVSIFDQQNNAKLVGGVDSDSSDDEILPVNAISNKKNSIASPIGTTKPKKNQNADSDPLGVDMNIDFSSVGGLSNYIDQLKEMVALPLLYPEVYKRFDITPPRGVLFHGPPGTGKTLMARALAASCSSEGQKITFFMRKGADCLSKWVGEAERQLRLLFEEAKKQQPSIIFFDEIDGLAPVRSSKQEQIHASIVSTLLALMDGMDNRGQVIVIGATNRPDAVDPALRRPGRFDREFYFPLPDINSREEILTIHTKKWDPPLPNQFIKKIAHLSKGYGGADLRALCTEAALNSIQRRYPQIYETNDKLKIDPSTISVSARDFMKALDKIVPSSARSLSSGSAPIPEHLESLLNNPLKSITTKLDKLGLRAKKLTTLEEAKFIDPTENDEDGGFGKHELIKRLELSRVHRPRLLICGEPGNGQQYLGSAVLNHLEGFNIQSLDLSSVFGDTTRTAENVIIQSFIEAKRHKPSVIFIPSIDIWYETIPDSAKSTLAGLLRSLSSNERVVLLGVSELPLDELSPEMIRLFGISDTNFVSLLTPNSEQRSEFFRPLWNALGMKPTEYLVTRRKKKLEKLEKLKLPVNEEHKEENLKSFEKQDMQLRNTLKIKLSGLMELMKQRYRKFKKPIIDDAYLVHLFEPLPPNSVSPAYSLEGNMILENHTQRKYFNMDLDTVEEKLWNGFYLAPKEFLKDVEMIYKDAVTSQDRERLIKASEMYANVQVSIEEMSQPEFIEKCKGLKRRERKRNELKALEKAKEEEISVASPNLEATVGLGVAAGSQLQIQEISTANGDAIFDFSTKEQLNGNSTPGTLNGGSNDELKQSTEPDFKSAAQPETNQYEQKEHEIQEIEKETGDQKTSNERKEESEEREEKEKREEKEEESDPEELDLPFELNQTKVRETEQSLIEETDGLSVEQLEQLNALLMEVIWEDRQKWDRSETLEKLSKELFSRLRYLKE